MKMFFIVLSGLLAALSTRAASDVSREVATLGTQRDEAVTAFYSKVDADYLTRLEALKRRAMSTGDLDAALVIDREIVSLKTKPADASPGVMTEEAFRAKLFAGRWLWIGADRNHPVHFVFLTNGLSSSGFHWQVLNTRDVKIWGGGDGSAFWVVRFTDEVRIGRGVPEISTINDAAGKSIEPDVSPAAPTKSEGDREGDSSTPFGRRVTR